MSLFPIADGIKVRSVYVKRLSRKIRSACSEIDSLKNARTPRDAEKHRHELKLRNAIHYLLSTMKEYTTTMAEINTHLLEIRKHLKP